MTAPRRLAFLLGLVVAVVPVTAASAHVCSTPAVVDVDAPIVIDLGVPAEEKAVVGFEVALPEEFRFQAADPLEGWTVQRDGATVRFRGGPIRPFACEYFVLRGEVSREGKLLLPLTTHHRDGSTMRYESDKINDPFGAQLVFAGTVPSDADYIGQDGSGGGWWRSAFGVVRGLTAGIIAGLALAWLMARRRRREAEGRTAPQGRPAPRRPARRRR